MVAAMTTNFSANSLRRDPGTTDTHMKAIHILAGIEVVYGGPSYSVPRLCMALARSNVDTVLFSVTGTNDVVCSADVPNFRFATFPRDYAGIPILRDLHESSGLASELRRTALGADVVHDHGLWLMPNVHAGREAVRAGKPLVVSPRGMLSKAALSFSRWKKRAFWLLLQKEAIRSAACFHATGEGEYQDIRAMGLRNPVAIIPNGIDIPDAVPVQAQANPDERIVLSLGRIHPKKGLDRLVQAWAALEAVHPQWRLKIVGSSEVGYVEALKTLAGQLGLQRINFHGPVYGDDKTAMYREADLFVLPSLNENFGLTVAESLAAGTPVIATRGTPWGGLEQEGCGWWVEHGVEPLAAAMKTAMAMPRASLQDMGQKGRAWMERDFSWDRVSLDMIALYGWLAGKGPMPKTVRLD